MKNHPSMKYYSLGFYIFVLPNLNAEAISKTYINNSLMTALQGTVFYFIEIGMCTMLENNQFLRVNLKRKMIK